MSIEKMRVDAELLIAKIWALDGEDKIFHLEHIKNFTCTLLEGEKVLNGNKRVEKPFVREHISEEKKRCIRMARQYCHNHWPDHLTSGVMFFMGEKISKEEFEDKTI